MTIDMLFRAIQVEEEKNVENKKMSLCSKLQNQVQGVIEK